MSKPPMAVLDFAPAEVTVKELDGGAIVLSSPMPLKPYSDSIGEFIRHWSSAAPDRTFLAERNAEGGWRKVNYRETRDLVESLAQALIDRGLNEERPLMILSDNSVNNGLLQQAAMYVGIPVAPISPAYSLMSQDHAKLKHIFAKVTPGLIYVENGAMFAGALKALDLNGVAIAIGGNPAEGMDCVTFAEMAETDAGTEVEEAFAKVGPDTLAKILFTSGSTGMPKGVKNTQRMMCSNQQAILQLWPFLKEKPPVMVDWLPWNHTFGGNHNFNMALSNGGTLYVDSGKPAPVLVEKTVETLREISPTMYFNVPRGYDMLTPYMEKDEALRKNFFKDLDMIFYAAAALPQSSWEKLEDLSISARGDRVCMLSAWGSTETAPMATSVHFPIEKAGVIGLPAPGTEIKMVPNGGKMELRIKGPNITPGYFRDDEKTRASFDEDGYYIIGDAGKFADPNDPNKGIVFDGRTAEDFKLTTGTWVNVGNLRIGALAATAPIVQDAVVTGHDREDLGLLIFPNPVGCASIAGKSPDTPLADLIADPAVIAKLKEGLAAYNKDNPASSTRSAHVIMMTELPSIDAGEITDKGYINQRAVLERRADLVEALYNNGDGVIAVG
jgi:feruloyl-CoA synthase